MDERKGGGKERKEEQMGVRNKERKKEREEERKEYGKFFFTSGRRHTRSFHVTGVQTFALPIL